MVDILGYFKFFFSNRREVYNIRKKYDKIREGIDKKENSHEKIALLRMLDQIEPNIATLEEQKLPGAERRRLRLYINSSLSKINNEIKMMNKNKYQRAKRRL
jgi:hypothetical protein